MLATVHIIERIKSRFSHPHLLYDILDATGGSGGGGAIGPIDTSGLPIYAPPYPPLPSPLPPAGTVNIGDLGNQNYPNTTPSPPGVYGGGTTGVPGQGGGGYGYPTGGGGGEGGGVGSTTGIGGLGGGRATSYPPLVGLPPATSSSSGGTPVSSSGINWSNVLSGLGQSIQGFGQGYLAPRGQAQGQQPTRGTQIGAGGATNQPPRMQTQAPQIPIQMHPQAMPGGSAIATAPISPIQLPSGSFAPLSPNILTTPSPMPRFIGSYQMGGIVPRTGLYPVQGGEKIIPKKRVQKIAKLHKGELVLPARYMGSYQQGGDIPLDPTQLPPGSAAPLPTDITGYPTTAAQPPTTRDKIMYAALNLAKLRQQQQPAALGGGASPVRGGGVVFPGRVGTLGPIMAPPQMNTVGGAFGTSGGAVGNLMQQAGLSSMQIPQIAGIPQGGAPMQPGSAGGPMAYSQGASLPPYQSQFAPGGRAQYVTQNLLGGLSNAILLYKQRQFDKTAETSKADAIRKMQIEQERQQQQQQPQQQPAAPGTQQAAMQNVMGSSQPNMPTYTGSTQQGQTGPAPQMTAEEMTTWQSLQKQNPKLGEKFYRDLQRQEARSMRDYAKAQTDPSSPQYRGYMMAYQEKQQQQTAQAEMQARQMNAAAQAANAQSEALRTQMQVKMYGQMQDLFGQEGGIDKLIEPLKPLKPEEKAIWDAAKLKAASSLNPGEVYQGVKDIGDRRITAGQVHGGKELVQDPNSTMTGLSWLYRDANGKEVSRTQNAFVPSMATQVTSSQQVVTNQDGSQVLVPKTTIRQREIPGQGGPKQSIPTGTMKAPATPGSSPTRTGSATAARGVTTTPIYGPGGVPLHKPLPAAGQTALSQVTFGLNMADEIQPTINQVAQELEKKGSTLWDAAKIRSSWETYMAGIDPSNIDPRSPAALFPQIDHRIADLFPFLAQMQMVGSRPYLQGSRNWNYIQQIQQHLPNPATDTPTLMASKLRNLERTGMQLEASIYVGAGIHPRMDRQTATRYMNLSGMNQDKASAMAKADGWDISHLAPER